MADRIIEKFKHEMLQLCIEDVHVWIDNLSRHIIDHLNFLRTQLPEVVINDFIGELTLRNEALRSKANGNLANKFKA